MVSFACSVNCRPADPDEYQSLSIMTNLKIAFRHLWKNKFYTFINLSGLAIGMAACWLIAVFVRNELGYDRLTDQSDRICQVNVAGNFGGMSFITSNSPPPAGSALAAE